MWLIEADTLKLKSFPSSEALEYAILSHTWGDEEVTFQEFAALGNKSKAGWEKITKTCELAKVVGLQYAWIDTCCIDKTSSAELSEAINSMFSWYKNSTICFIHLSALADDQRAQHVGIDDFAKYRWFYRGWTLQELIAPANATFLNRNWEFMGTKRTLISRLAKVTGIDTAVLNDLSALPTVPVARRLSWAAGRKTTRQEDLAYCLLGLFNVNMPLIYGEGQKAFIRLQEAIAHSANDLSMFAWQQDSSSSTPLIPTYRGIFACSPTEFQHCNKIFVPYEKINQETSFALTNKGLRFDPGMFITADSDDTCVSASPDLLMGLDCFEKSDRTSNAFKWVAIRLRKLGGDRYVRVLSSKPFYTQSRISRLNSTHREIAYVIPSLSDRDAAVIHTNTTIGIFYHQALGGVITPTIRKRHSPQASRRIPFDAIYIADRFGSHGLQSCVHLHFLTVRTTNLSTHRVALVCGLRVKPESPSLEPWALLCSKNRFPPDHPISKHGVFFAADEGNAEMSISRQDQTELFRDYVYETCSDSGRPSPKEIDRTVVLTRSSEDGSNSEPD